MNNKSEVKQLGVAIVTARGLFFEGRFYTNSKMIKNKWFEFAAKDGEWFIPILYQPSNQETLVLLDVDTQEVATTVEANLVSPSSELDAYYEKMQSLKERYFQRGI
jgi:hypothetical protein